jgi:CRISPR-associated protein Cas2
MLVIICYDIFEDRRRLHVMNAIEGYGYRVQGSVYECHLDKRRLTELKHAVSRFIHPETDRVRYYILCGRDKSDIVCYGKGMLPEDSGVIVL